MLSGWVGGGVARPPQCGESLGGGGRPRKRAGNRPNSDAPHRGRFSQSDAVCAGFGRTRQRDPQ